MRRGLLAVALAIWPVLGSAAPVDDLTAALRLPELAVLMRDEGVKDSEDLFVKAPAGRLPALTLNRIEEIFDPERIEAEMRQSLAAGMTGDEMARATAFFDSPPGRALTELELVARSAMSDDDIEAIARSEWQARRDEDSDEIRLLRQFAEVNGLIDRNTTSTMTARYQFLRGLGEGQGQPVDDDEILFRVWSAEESIRAETEDWLMGYLLMAYGPADLDDLRDYVAFSETPAGQAVNTALFDGFAVVYGRISHDLGLVAGQAAMAQDL